MCENPYFCPTKSFDTIKYDLMWGPSSVTPAADFTTAEDQQFIDIIFNAAMRLPQSCDCVGLFCSHLNQDQIQIKAGHWKGAMGGTLTAASLMWENVQIVVYSQGVGKLVIIVQRGNFEQIWWKQWILLYHKTVEWLWLPMRRIFSHCDSSVYTDLEHACCSITSNASTVTDVTYKFIHSIILMFRLNSTSLQAFVYSKYFI